MLEGILDLGSVSKGSIAGFVKKRSTAIQATNKINSWRFDSD